MVRLGDTPIRFDRKRPFRGRMIIQYHVIILFQVLELTWCFNDDAPAH
jgi:hypothetical protein